MKLPIKLFTAVMAMALNSGLCLAQNENNVITHTIARGETLTSIAKRYSVSEAKIIELNPDAAQFVYVGMDLKIPTNATPAAESSLTGGKESYSSEPETKGTFFKTVNDPYIYAEADSDSNDFNRWDISDCITYGFVPKPDGASSSFAFLMTLGVDYRFNRNFYAGGKLGYRRSSTNYRNKDLDLDIHAIALPMELGYQLWPGNFTFIPYVGIEFDYIVSAKRGGKSLKIKSSKRLCAGGRIGGWISLWGFRIGAAYVFPLNDNFGDEGYPEIGIGFVI